MVSRSFAQLRATFDAYQRLTGKDIESSIVGETAGDLEEALVAIGIKLMLWILRIHK